MQEVKSIELGSPYEVLGFINNVKRGLSLVYLIRLHNGQYRLMYGGWHLSLSTNSIWRKSQGFYVTTKRFVSKEQTQFYFNQYRLIKETAKQLYI